VESGRAADAGILREQKECAVAASDVDEIVGGESDFAHNALQHRSVRACLFLPRKAGS
jgi:hypothetical protein